MFIPNLSIYHIFFNNNNNNKNHMFYVIDDVTLLMNFLFPFKDLIYENIYIYIYLFVSLFISWHSSSKVDDDANFAIKGQMEKKDSLIC